MTDNRSTIAGNYQGTGPVIECILDEGAPTYRAKQTMPTGETIDVCVFASPLEEGMQVALSNDTANTYAATEGMPVVEVPVNGEALVIGTIVSPPKLQRMPSSTDADDDTLAERLAGKYYRVALVELHIAGKIVAADVYQNGTNATVPGVATTLAANLTSGKATGARGYKLIQVASGGQGAIPLHYVAAGSSGDLSTCLVLLTGLVASVTGA